MKFAAFATRLAAASALFAVAALCTVAPAMAQHSRSNSDSKSSAQPAPMYPNATREEPELDLRSQDLLDELNKGLDAANSGDEGKAKAILVPIANGQKGDSKYAQALARQGLATTRFHAGDKKGGIESLKMALANGVLPNDTYFQLMYELAQFYMADGQYAKALTTLQHWRKEGRRETADSYAMEGNINYRLENYQAAIDALNKAKSLAGGVMKPRWSQLLAASYAESGQGDQALAMANEALAANPKDAVTLRNTAVLLMQSGKYEQAAKRYQQGIDSGVLTESADFINLAKSYMITAQGADNPQSGTDKAIAVLEKGLAAGVLKPGYDVYILEGDAAAIAMDYTKALAIYKKAAPYAKDGELDLERAKMFMAQERYGSAASAAHTALDKGVKHTGEAYLVLGAAESARKHRHAAVEAVRKAANYPQSKAKAKAWLKKVGA